LIRKIKLSEGAVELQRLPDLAFPLGPVFVVSKISKIKMRQHQAVEGQRLSDRPPSHLTQRSVFKIELRVEVLAL
jgi:hypothetical protein